MCLLKIRAADFAARDVRGNGQHGYATAMTVVETVDEVHVAWSAASGADGQFTGQVRLRSGSKGSDLFMAHRDPFDLLVLADFFQETVEGIPHNSVDAFYSRRDQSFDNNFCYSYHSS